MDRKEALEFMRRYFAEDNGKVDTTVKVALQVLVPELDESEDERIRKYLIRYVKNAGCGSDLFDSINTKEVILAYLEKQKEQKPANPFSGVSFDYDGHGYGMCARDNGIEVTKDRKIIYRSVPPFIGQNPMTEEHIANVFEKVGLAKIIKEQGNDALTNAAQSTMIELSQQETQKEQEPGTVEKLREISTPADEDWFEIEKMWEEEDNEDLRSLISVKFTSNAKVIDGKRFAVLSWEKFKNIALEIINRGKEYFWNPTEEDVAFFNKAVTTNTSLTPQDRAKLDIIRMKFKHRPNIEQKEQKPADDKAFEEWIDDWWKHNRVNNPDSYDKGDEIQFDEQGFKNFCRRIRNMYQQKPVNWTELNGEDIAKLEVLINNVHNEYPNGIGQESFGDEVLERFREYKGDEDLDEKEQKPAQFKGRSLAKIIKREFEGFRNLLKKKGIDYEPPSTYWESFARLFYSSAREYLKGQKPAEWSKEDESQLNWFYSLLDYIGEEFPVTWGLNEISGKKWLKSLPERLILQPKQEWSKEDEDEEALNMCLDVIPKKWKTKSGILLTKWLKDNIYLQSKPKWSDEECGRLFDIEHYLDGTLQLSPDRKIACIDFIKSLRSQSYLKLDKKQKTALWNAIGFIQHRVGLRDERNGSINGMDYPDMLKLLESLYDKL